MCSLVRLKNKNRSKRKRNLTWLLQIDSPHLKERNHKIFSKLIWRKNLKMMVAINLLFRLLTEIIKSWSLGSGLSFNLTD